MREHLYYPVLQTGHALVAAARITFLEPGGTDDDLIGVDIWETIDGVNRLPNPWMASPAIIDCYFTDPLRLRLKVEEYLGTTYYLEDIDVYPSGSQILYASVRGVRIRGTWDPHYMLRASNSTIAVWGNGGHSLSTPDNTYYLPMTDIPPVPVASTSLAAGEGAAPESTYVNQTVTWTRDVADATQGYGPPTETIHFRQSDDGQTYIEVILTVDELNNPLITIKQFTDGALDETYFNNQQNLIAYPVDGETMSAVLIGSNLAIYQSSVGTDSIANYTVKYDNSYDPDAEVLDGHAFDSGYDQEIADQYNGVITTVHTDSTDANNPSWT